MASPLPALRRQLARLRRGAGRALPLRPGPGDRAAGEAGYADGLEFRAIIGSGAEAYIQFGELLQAQLAEVGIEMDLELVEEAGAQPDIESARPLYQELNRAVAEDLFQIIPVYADAAITGHQANVGGLHPGLIDVDPSPEFLRGVFVAED